MKLYQSKEKNKRQFCEHFSGKLNNQIIYIKNIIYTSQSLGLNYKKYFIKSCKIYVSRYGIPLSRISLFQRVYSKNLF